MVQPRTHIIEKSEKIKISSPTFLIFTTKEIIWMLIFSLIASFISFIPLIPTTPSNWITRTSVFLIIILSSVSSKKLISKRYSIKIEHSPWKFQRYWFRNKDKFKIPIYSGVIFPLFFGFFSLGSIMPFSFLQYDAENLKEKRLLKSRGTERRRKDEINEEDLAYTSATGFYILIILAVIGWLIKPAFPTFGYEISKYSIYYGLWNLIPISQLDGTKLFFGGRFHWAFIVLIYLLFLPFAIL